MRFVTQRYTKYDVFQEAGKLGIINVTQGRVSGKLTALGPACRPII